MNGKKIKAATVSIGVAIAVACIVSVIVTIVLHAFGKMGEITFFGLRLESLTACLFGFIAGNLLYDKLTKVEE